MGTFLTMTPSRRAAAADARILDADPDLVAGLDPEQAELATQQALARVHYIERGPWRPKTSGAPGPDLIGLLLLEGLIVRTLAIAERSSTEILGAGDLLRPWQRDGEDGLVPTRVEWRVLDRARVALLDGRFAASIAPWPQIGAALVGRALRRARWQGVLATFSHMTRVDQRLLLLFWHFAERWGRVRPDGVVVRLPLTHETLGALIGARRPSVTSALSALAEQGLLEPLDRGEWMLTEAAGRWLEELRDATEAGRGEWPASLEERRGRRAA
jgi:DNA-binding transcriptional ArsR family regulator